MSEPTAPIEAVDPFAGQETTFEEYSKYREDGTVPERFKKAETEVKKEEVKEPPVAEKAKTAEGEEPSEETEQEKEERERDEKGKFRKKVEFSAEQQEAFDRAFRKREAKLRREYEDKIAQFATKTSAPQATAAEKPEIRANEPPSRPELPKLAEYKGTIEEFQKEVEEYPAKLSAYLNAEREAKEKSSSVQKRLDESEAKARKSHADYETEFEALTKDIAAEEEPKLPPHVIKGVAEESEDPHELTYYLAKNRAEFRRFAALEPHQVLREVLKTDFKLANTPAPVKEPPKPKPAPPEPVGARATVSAFDVNDEKLDVDEWARQRNEQLRKRRGR